MPTVKFINEKKEIEVQPGANLRRTARENGITIHHDSLLKRLTWDYPLGLLASLGIPIAPAVAEFPDKLVNSVFNCHGFGHCGTCHVYVKKGMENCSRRGRWERFRLAVATFSIGHEAEVRLACQTRVEGDIEVQTRPETNLSGERFWE